VFGQRATELERIDTGDYTRAEYETFLREIAFINRYLGDGNALKRSLLSEIETEGLRDFSVLDVGCGSGELLRQISAFARRSGRRAVLTGIDLNPLSAAATRDVSGADRAFNSVQGNAFSLPFADGSFDYVISSLFFHHLTDGQIPEVLREIRRVSTRGFFVIDLHRHPAAYFLYKLFCMAFRISPLVREDGALSVRRGFKPGELAGLVRDSGMSNVGLTRRAPFRLVAHVRSEIARDSAP
jgi:SAM-dependent methyltransferase